MDAEELLWRAEPGPRRGPKPSLTRAEVVRAAIAVADADGLDALAMQRVAERLGVATMALYRYVPGKHELISLMLDAAVGAPPSGPPSGSASGSPWREALAGWARGNREVFRRHPWVLPLVGGARMMGPNELAWTEAGLRALEPTGLPPARRLEVLVVVNGFVRAAAADETAAPRLPGAEALAAFPLFRSALEGLSSAEDADEERFEFGLGLVLEGVRRLVEGAECLQSPDREIRSRKPTHSSGGPSWGHSRRWDR